MNSIDKKQVANEILKQRRLSYSIELINVQGDNYTVLNNFGTTITYIKKGDNYFLEDELM